MGVKLAALVIALAALGCASETVCHNLEPTNCVQRGGAPEAIATAGAATVAWGVAGGCRINGCGPGYLRCNPETELCERIPCGEGEPCPSMYECDHVARVCK